MNIPPKSLHAISVVLPVGPSLIGLREQLEALTPQLEGMPNRELIVSINDELVLQSQELQDLRSFLKHSNVRFKILDSTHRLGPSYARNAGWKAATGEFVLFCDSDDVVGNNWVDFLAVGLESRDLLGGPLDYELLNTKSLRSWQPDRTLGLSSKFGFLPYIATCNMGVKAELLKSLDGFDEGLTTGEDIDFCWRAQISGTNVGFSKQAYVSYRLRSTFRGSFAQSYDYAKGDLVLREKFASEIPKSLSSNLIWIFMYSLVSVFASLLKIREYRKFASKLGYWLGLSIGMLTRKPSAHFGQSET